MATIEFQGMCNGTQTKQKRDGTGSYQITEFVDISEDGMGTFQVFGDLKLSKSLELKLYRLRAMIVKLGDVQVLSIPAKTGKS